MNAKVLYDYLYRIQIKYGYVTNFGVFVIYNSNFTMNHKNVTNSHGRTSREQYTMKM